MVVLTCLSYPIPLDALEIELFARRSDLDITGTKTGYNAGDPHELKIDVCLTALLMIPILFIPNLIQKESDDVRKEVRDIPTYYLIIFNFSSLDRARVERVETLHSHPSTVHPANTSVCLATSPTSPTSTSVSNQSLP